MLDLILTILLYAIPLYIANATPIVSHGSIPIDLNLTIKGKLIFGKGKTILGALSGVLAGSVAGIIIVLVFPYALTLVPNYVLLAVTLSIGAILGDMVKSFFKRRFGIKSGEKWILADQLDFILGGLVLSFVVRLPEWWLVLLLLFATFFIHLATNFAAYELKLKKVPW